MQKYTVFRTGILIFWLIFILGLNACLGKPMQQRNNVTPSSPITTVIPYSITAQSNFAIADNPLPEFPLNLGNIWVYSSEHYDTDGTKPITGTYIITETVVDVYVQPPYYAAQLFREETLISSSDNWQREQSGWLGHYWYIINGTLVYLQRTELDLSNLDSSEKASLEYIFPLSDGKQWYPDPWQRANFLDFKNKTGLRKVNGPMRMELPAGEFENCFLMTKIFGGEIKTRFCSGIGIVGQEYDHGGTPFGFEELLIDYKVQ